MIIDKKIVTQCRKISCFLKTYGGFPKPGNKIEKQHESSKNENKPLENMKADIHIRFEWKRKTEQ
jgi:hypothetical protein